MEIKEIKEFVKKCLKEDAESILIQITAAELTNKEEDFFFIGGSYITKNAPFRYGLFAVEEGNKIHNIEKRLVSLVKGE